MAPAPSMLIVEMKRPDATGVRVERNVRPIRNAATRETVPGSGAPRPGLDRIRCR